MEMTMDVCDGDYLGAYRRFLEHFVANVSQDDQLPVRMTCREVRECEVTGEIADITLKHLNQRICPPSLQAYLVKLVRDECKILFQKQPEECGYRPQEKKFLPLKLMQTVTNKVNEICQRYLDNSRLALLPPPPSIPLPLASSYAIKNRRRKMEDRSVILHDIHTMFSIKNDAVVNYYAVFDGHGGQEAATYCAAHLHQYLIESPHYPTDPELALRDAFYTTDSRFLECDETKNSGATAVCALLYDKTLYIAWAGDSQAALIKNGRGINLTIPHKPERPDEKSRIELLGGEVIFYGSWRVNGVLNVSRSLGDAKYKPFVSGEPEMKKIELDGTEDFLIVACDGFWERATEDIVASLLYEYVTSSDCDYNSTSVALVNWAKQNLSEDNISVIVVFLTPPAEIAAKLFFEPRPAPQTSTMEQPGYQDQADLDFSNFAKQPQQQEPPQPDLPSDESFIQHTNGGGNDHFVPAALETVNGRHRPKPPRYNDDDDEDDEDEEEEEEDDLGPETNVDDSAEDFGKLDQAMGQNYPDEFLQHGKREDDDFPMEIKQRHQNELIAEADNVADSEDSEDEWNYYRPEENKQQQQQNSNSLGQSQKDPSLVEKPDRCDEEKEPCSPKPCDEDSEDEAAAAQFAAEAQQSRESQLEEFVAATVLDDADAEDVVTAEYDELHEQQIVAKDQLKELDIEAESATIPEEDFPYDKEPEQQQFNDQFEQQPKEPQFNEQPEQQQFNEQFEQQQLSEQFEQQQLGEPLEQQQLNEQFEQQPEKQTFVEQIEQQQFNEQFEQQSEHQQSNEHLKQQQINEHLEQQQINEHTEQQQFNEHTEQQQFNELTEQQQFNEHTEQQQFNEHTEQQQFNEHNEQQQFSEQSEQLNLEKRSKELYQSDEKLEEHLDIVSEPEQELDTEEENDMESHLNPDAAEFVPTSTSTSPLIPPIINQMSSDLVAGSPLKQSQRALKNRKIPSEQEFQDEISHRPSEIDDSALSDYSNGDVQSPVKDTTNSDLLSNFANENQCTVINPLNLDESEISSTRAEFGDESNFSVASELYKTGLSTVDCSYTGSERSDFEFSAKDPMATSMTPGDFKTAFEQEPDLNKVHMLNDEDLMGDVQNGTIEETSEKIVDDAIDDDLVKEKIELDFENFIPQQEQNAEVFSAIVEQKESADNKDMFMNLRNNEHGYELEQNKEEHNLIEPAEQSDVTSTENEKIAEFAIDNNPVYASNNPFSSDYVPASEQANNVQNLVDDVYNNTAFDEPKQQNFDSDSVLTPEEPEMQKSVHNEVMQNPLDLNFGGASAEQKNDEPVLVSPVKEPQVMSSKFEEEDLMSRSVETLPMEQNQKQDQDELLSKNSYVEDLIPGSVQPEENLIQASSLMDDVHEVVAENLDKKSINLSESLQEFTGLEEQLSYKHEVKDNIIETPPILKENLVDEQKDVEEAKAASLIPEPKLEEAPQVTNELPVSNETAENAVSPAVTVAAAAAAVTTAVAVGAVAATATKPAKPSTVVSKTSKPTATSKIGSKSTTPTSPTKTGVAAKTGTTAAAKKPATAAAPRAKSAIGTTAKTATSTVNKTTAAAKTATAPKTAASTATKTTRTGTTTAAASRSKPLSSITSKISSTSATEKKPTTNGEVKPPPIGRSAPPKKPLASVTSTASKTGLVSKTSTTTRTSTSTTSAPKPRPASAATTKTTVSKLSSANVTSSTNSTSPRPKTAPTSTLNSTAKSKIAGAKSPMIDKQIKETANKQISSARSSTTSATTKSRLLNVTSSTTTTAATKRTSLVQKQSTAGVAASPTKKPAPISKPGSKTSTVTSKVNSKVTSTTKNGTTTAATAKVVQNGVCEPEKTVEISTNNSTTVDTTNIEEDIPKKDISPIEPVTDNQLITAE